MISISVVLPKVPSSVQLTIPHTIHHSVLYLFSPILGYVNIIPAPVDTSTPHYIQLSETQRLRARRALPRSPLFVAHNALSSPEHCPTSGLTPRVTSHVATQNTPGIIFGQPARRPPRCVPRT